MAKFKYRGRDSYGKVVEGMATKWETSEDKKTWTFTINDKAYWSNGDKVTAHDFEYAWKRTLNPETGSQYGFIFYDNRTYRSKR